MAGSKKNGKDKKLGVKENRNGQISRAFAIMSILENHPRGLTVKQLHEKTKDEYKGQERTIRRDLDLIRAAGFHVVEEGADPESGASLHKLDRKTKIGDYLVLDSKELIGLYFARNVLTPLRDTPFYVDLQRLFRKIEDKLGAKNSQYLQEIEADFHFEPGPAWGLGLTPEVIDCVRAACAEGQYFSCDYASANSQSISARKLGPHFVYYMKGALYLLAEDTKDSKVKAFGLARMKNPVMLDESYCGEKSDPETFFASSLGLFRGEGEPEEIKIAFSPTIAPYVSERSWHSSQTIVKRPGGIVELSMSVFVNPDLLHLILSFGPGATVLAPEHLKEKVIDAASRVMENYSGKFKQAG